jgi:hypothetical protein
VSFSFSDHKSRQLDEEHTPRSLVLRTAIDKGAKEQQCQNREDPARDELELGHVLREAHLTSCLNRISRTCFVECEIATSSSDTPLEYSIFLSCILSDDDIAGYGIGEGAVGRKVEGRWQKGVKDA